MYSAIYSDTDIFNYLLEAGAEFEQDVLKHALRSSYFPVVKTIFGKIDNLELPSEYLIQDYVIHNLPIVELLLTHVALM